MAEFLTTNGTSNCIEQIILKSEKKLVLVTPYLQLSKTFTERLMDASNRGVNIKIIYGKNELESKQKNMLSKFDNLELYFFQNLHAKCYFNEKNMVITSMNMYEFSEKNNREMGISIDRIKDKEIFENAMNETHSIIKSSKIEVIEKEVKKITIKESVPEDPKKKKPAISFNESNRIRMSKLKGYCIRCNTPIKKDPDEPFCDDCEKIWQIYQNEDFEEKYCHTCGDKKTFISRRRPLCHNCFVQKRWLE